MTFYGVDSDEKADINFQISRVRFLTGIEDAPEKPKRDPLNNWQENYYRELNKKHSKNYGNFKKL